MSEIDIVVWLTIGYAAFLVLAAYGLDLMAKRVSRHAADWRNGSFTYHKDHDAWVCPQDEWLWPQSFDPEARVIRYRASPVVCNSCPVKAGCTTSESGREIFRNVDPWPYSEAGRFHRGIACSLAVLACLLPLVATIGRSPREAALLVAAAVLVGLAGLPLWSHLRQAPAGFVDHLPVDHRGVLGPDPVRIAGSSPQAADRVTTRWGGFGAPQPPDGAPKPGWRRINRS